VGAATGATKGNIKRRFANCIQGREYKVGWAAAQEESNRPPSAISVIEPSKPDGAKMKRALMKGHPLHEEDPDDWNNVPMCVAHAFKNFK